MVLVGMSLVDVNGTVNQDFIRNEMSVNQIYKRQTVDDLNQQLVLAMLLGQLSMKKLIRIEFGHQLLKIGNMFQVQLN